MAVPKKKNSNIKQKYSLLKRNKWSIIQKSIISNKYLILYKKYKRKIYW